jgi:F-type H+-transporting ATPase subunit b
MQTTMWMTLLALWPEEGQAAAHEAAQPLIDLDNTVFVEFGLFLLMLMVLHFLVFRPYLRARAERDDRIDGERTRAREMEDNAKAKIADLEAGLEKAKQSGIALRMKARGEAAARERAIVEGARAESQRMVETQRAEVTKAGEAARGKLRLSAEDWARHLATRILGREVA